MLRDFRNEKIHSILFANQFGFFLNSDLSFHADGVEKCPKNVHILYKSLKHVLKHIYRIMTLGAEHRRHRFLMIIHFLSNIISSFRV